MEAVIEQLKYIYKNFDEGNIMISLFLDFSKVFDCIDNETLMNKLFLCGVGGMALQWFDSYVSSSKVYTTVKTVLQALNPYLMAFPKDQYWVSCFS